MLLTSEEIEAIFDSDNSSARRQDLIDRLVDEHAAAFEMGAIALAALATLKTPTEVAALLEAVADNETNVAQGKKAFEDAVGLRF